MDSFDSQLFAMLDYTLADGLPTDAVAFCVNISRVDCNSEWALDIITSDWFDPENPDWACEDLNAIDDGYLEWQQVATWNEIHHQVCQSMKRYLTTGEYRSSLIGLQAGAVGFVDGDLEIIYNR